MEEFSTETECPHCGEETHITAVFDFREADQGGCNSGISKETCGECYEEFYFNSYVSFEVSVNQVWKKNPVTIKKTPKSKRANP